MSVKQGFVKPKEEESTITDDKIHDTIQLLVFTINKYKVDTNKLYSKFDKSKKQQMGVSDFEEMVKRIDANLTKEDI